MIDDDLARLAHFGVRVTAIFQRKDGQWECDLHDGRRGVGNLHGFGPTLHAALHKAAEQVQGEMREPSVEDFL